MADNTKPIPPEPLAVMKAFVDAGTRGDADAMKACLTKQTIESGQFHGEQPQGVRFTFGEPAWEEDLVVIPMTGTPEDPAAAGMPPMQMQCVMVQEDGAWKFDLVATMERMLGGSMKAAVEQVAGVMKDAMEGIGNAMSEALGSAFGSESQDEAPPDWSNATLTPTPEELLPQPEFEPLPKLSAGLSQALGFDVPAFSATKDLLRQVGSDDRTTLITWFEDSLFGAWPQLFAEAAQTIPLQGRLRSVRIEGAHYSEHRFLAIDGNDLVYRIYLNNTDGYFSDTEVQARLTGVLAALPDQLDDTTAGQRLLPDDVADAALEPYRQLVVPRFMRRISDLLGHPVRLELDWDRIDDQTRAARQFPRWLLNRVYGALALACADEALRTDLSQNLKTIRFDFVISPQYKYAKYEAGIFTVGIWYWEGERGSFYEFELLPALQGAKVGEEWVDSPEESAAAEQSIEEPQDATPPAKKGKSKAPKAKPAKSPQKSTAKKSNPRKRK